MIPGASIIPPAARTEFDKNARRSLNLVCISGLYGIFVHP